MSSRKVWAYGPDSELIKTLQGKDGLVSSQDVISHLLACKELADLPRVDWCGNCEEYTYGEVKVTTDEKWTSTCKRCGVDTDHFKAANLRRYPL